MLSLFFASGFAMNSQKSVAAFVEVVPGTEGYFIYDDDNVQSTKEGLPKGKFLAEKGCRLGPAALKVIDLDVDRKVKVNFKDADGNEEVDLKTPSNDGYQLRIDFQELYNKKGDNAEALKYINLFSDECDVNAEIIGKSGEIVLVREAQKNMVIGSLKSEENKCYYSNIDFQDLIAGDTDGLVPLRQLSNQPFDDDARKWYLENNHSPVCFVEVSVKDNDGIVNLEDSNKKLVGRAVV